MNDPWYIACRIDFCPVMTQGGIGGLQHHYRVVHPEEQIPELRPAPPAPKPQHPTPLSPRRPRRSRVPAPPHQATLFDEEP